MFYYIPFTKILQFPQHFPAPRWPGRELAKPGWFSWGKGNSWENLDFCNTGRNCSLLPSQCQVHIPHSQSILCCKYSAEGKPCFVLPAHQGDNLLLHFCNESRLLKAVIPVWEHHRWQQNNKKTNFGTPKLLKTLWSKITVKERDFFFWTWAISVKHLQYFRLGCWRNIVKTNH